MTKTQAADAILKTLIAREFKANGGDIEKATDAVLGPGAFRALASSVYHGLRAKTA